MGGEMISIVGREFATFLAHDPGGQVRFSSELAKGDGKPLRILQIPFVEGEGAPMLVALLDEEEQLVAPAGTSAGSHVRGLVSLMPFGIALVDRDGRFIQMNSAFMRAAGVSGTAPPLYPGDLVVREDKAAVADAIRRFASGATHSADMAVRLKDHPEEPVALTIAGARGLGEAAVLLSLKDNSEESRLKREVAQATKMQAVGQLAGGVAHDFNNILTAIIGHCDLMLMRHSPGDSDYDDIQQIRTNSNRAASLTRQLLAFSRQQTLRPQILQLPDVVSEVSNLLKRLLGERVRLDVSHGRNLGPVRADPGQLEQVVVNLAVNARDAILENEPAGGGILTIQTRAVSMADARALNNDILPAADYTALIMSDNGTGIPPEILGKIFEPFFTTKELGKGTGLGLSTVYGIIKQSGGYIFADSAPGGGADTPSICRSMPPRPYPRQGEPSQATRQGHDPLGLRYDPARRGRGHGPRRGGARAVAAGLYRDLGGEWRGRARNAGQTWQARPPDLRRGHADDGRADDGRTSPQALSRPRRAVHVGLCRGAAAKVDHFAQCRLPAQALLRPAIGRGDPGRADPGAGRRPITTSGWREAQSMLWRWG